jgi:hypothetical protein
MDDSKPFRNFIEFTLDWHLIYREPREVERFAPTHIRDRATLVTEPVTVNLFLHVRKPE